MSLLDEVRAMKASGQLKHANLLSAGQEAVRLHKEGAFGDWVASAMPTPPAPPPPAPPPGWATSMKDSLLEAIEKGRKAKAAPSRWSWLTPLVQPLSALAVGAGAVGASKLMDAYSRHGVEDEVVSRFQREYLSTGRTEQQWQESGFESRIRNLHRDLLEIAPDVAARAPAALAAIRPVVQRPHMPHFTEAEVKDLTQTQSSIRSTKPAGAEQIATVGAIFKMTPDYTDVVKRLDEAVADAS